MPPASTQISVPKPRLGCVRLDAPPPARPPATTPPPVLMPQAPNSGAFFDCSPLTLHTQFQKPTFLPLLSATTSPTETSPACPRFAVNTARWATSLLQAPRGGPGHSLVGGRALSGGPAAPGLPRCYSPPHCSPAGHPAHPPPADLRPPALPSPCMLSLGKQRERPQARPGLLCTSCPPRHSHPPTCSSVSSRLSLVTF